MDANESGTPEEIKGGQRVAELLGLKKNKEGRFPTGWGAKTFTGLYKSVKRIVEETEKLSENKRK